jgi:hypothetical protein
MSLVAELEAGLELHLGALADAVDESVRRGVRARAPADDTDDRPEPVRPTSLRSIGSCSGRGSADAWTTASAVARPIDCGR